ncbi:MAG: glycosyltransferase family 39 protein [bacterium]
MEPGSIQYKLRVPFTLLAFLFVVIHFVFLVCYFEPAISTPDAQGYFVQAKLIAKQGRTYLEPESILQYIGPHWRHTSNNRYFATFPPGLPLILAIVYKIFGPKAALLLNPLMASLSLVGLFLLCRLWLGESWALLAIALMAINPFANEHALFGDSHTAVVFFLIWALFFLFQWEKTHSPWLAFITGLFIGVIPTIRYPEVLFCFAFGVFVLLHLQRDKVFWHSLIAGAIGALIPLGILCIRNQIVFGVFWKTGYTILRGADAFFAWNYFVDNSLPYLQKIMSEGCGLIFGLGVIGITTLCARYHTWKQGMLFALLVLPITSVYMSYYWKPDPQSMRYLLPTFPIYTIAGVWLLRQISEDRRLSAWASSIVLLLITIFWGLPQSLSSMRYLKKQNGVLAEVTNVVERYISAGSILITNEGISQHLDFIGHWRLVDASVLNSLYQRPPRMFAQSHNIAPPNAYRNIEAGLKYGNLAGSGLIDLFLDDVWQWAKMSRKAVYLIAKEKQINALKWHLLPEDRLVTIAEIKIPIGSPSRSNAQERLRPEGPMGPDQIFDFRWGKERLFLIKWIRKFPDKRYKQKGGLLSLGGAVSDSKNR